MQKKLLVIVLCLLFKKNYAQNATGFTLKVIEAQSKNALASVVVTIQNTSFLQLTSSTGTVVFEQLLPNTYYVLVHSQGYKDQLLSVNVHRNTMSDLGTILLSPDLMLEQQSATIALNEDQLNDDFNSSESTAPLLQASRDVFQQAAAFQWGQSRFRIRGLDAENATLLLNGIALNKLYDGRPQWGDWGGINDVLRNQEIAIGTAAFDYSFGGILGAQQINTRASSYRSGIRLSFAGTNTTYNWRMMATYASGVSKKGWALVISAGKRMGVNPYFEGTHFDGNSAFISIEKQINEKQAFNFTGIYTPNSRAKTAPNTAEVFALMGAQYNSYWGFQEGKKRNARIKTVEEPLLLLNHYFKINDKTQLQSAALYQWGKISNSNIDFQNANNPDPTYYRKMPSYFSSLFERDNGEFSGAFIPDTENAEKSRLAFLENPQINWNALYQANQKPVLDGKGNILRYEPSKSNYIVYEDRADETVWAANSLLNSQFSEHVSITAGAHFKTSKTQQYQKVVDLLGGSYFEDIDGFYTGDQAQSDLNHPNRQVVEGDKYGYNYFMKAQVIQAFTQFQFRFNSIHFYVGQQFSSTSYQREGLYKNGIYENNSLGKSAKVTFENFGFKAGMTYKISGKQAFLFHAAHLSKAPTIQNTFPNARLNNTIVAALSSETQSSLEATYQYRTPFLKMRLTTYFALQKNTTDHSFFYAEGIFDDGAGYTNTDAFVGQTLTGLDKQNLGAELSLEYPISSTLKTTLAAAYGRYIYASNPNVTVTNDAQASLQNTNPVFDFGKAILKNYYQEGMPQQAISLGIEYRDPHFWWIGTNLNFITESYVSVSPIARTAIFFRNPANGFPFPEATEERAKVLLQQEKLDPLLLLNFTGGKSWRIRGKNLGLFVSVSNLLDTHYQTGGYEQARNANFRARNQDVSSGTPNFGNKYFQGYGRNYFVSLYLNL
ncbi:hypothetical protein SAMN05444143_101141 [Flavobacterium succinicans]|uniref:TonB-dependent receptor n=1 Tax=Flavobacterium succinicans TaxID=29536 RepID=A0A1I4R0S6_9FLAO|nr:TonB-dependent receptor [Flavobacterium succinicans]SFM45857.1 hypothetical protein SAMN05444143_101141 [Flavobacterium succinicans]